MPSTGFMRHLALGWTHPRHFSVLSVFKPTLNLPIPGSAKEAEMSKPKLKRPAPGTVLGALALIVALAGNTSAFSNRIVIQGARSPPARSPPDARQPARVHSKALANGRRQLHGARQWRRQLREPQHRLPSPRRHSRPVRSARSPRCRRGHRLRPCPQLGLRRRTGARHRPQHPDRRPRRSCPQRRMDRLGHRDRFLRDRRTPAHWRCRLHQARQPRSRGDRVAADQSTPTRTASSVGSPATPAAPPPPKCRRSASNEYGDAWQPIE